MAFSTANSGHTIDIGLLTMIDTVKARNRSAAAAIVASEAHSPKAIHQFLTPFHAAWTNLMQHAISLSLPGHVGRRYKVQFQAHGETVDAFLRHRALTALTDLVLARLDCPEAGRTSLPRIIGAANKSAAIYDLRRAVDEAFDADGLGLELVRSAYWGEYSLEIEATAIRVEPPFRHLAPQHLSIDVVTRILALVAARQAAVIS